MKKNEIQVVDCPRTSKRAGLLSGVVALLCTLSILSFTGCEEPVKDNSKKKVISVTLAGTQTVRLYSGDAGSVAYFITVTGNNFDPFNLTGSNVKIGELNKGAIKLVNGISITGGAVSASGVETEFTVSVTGEVPAKVYELSVSVDGVISSNKVTLTVLGENPIAAVGVAPASNHGSVKAGSKGTLNYTITVAVKEGHSALPIVFPGNSEVSFSLANGDRLPDGIAAGEGEIITSGVPANFNISVNIGYEDTLDYSLVVRVYGKTSEPFALTVQPAVLTGEIGIDIDNTAKTLTADTSALPGTKTITYQWQRSDDGIVFTDIEGSAGNGKIYNIVPEQDVFRYFKARVKRELFADEWLDSESFGPIQNPQGAAIDSGTVNVNISGGALSADIADVLEAAVTGFPADSGLIYQWQHGTNASPDDFVFIKGAHSKTYTVMPEDIGLRIRAAVSVWGNSGYRYSAPTNIIAKPKTVTEQFADLAGKAPGAYTIFVFEDEVITPKELNHSGFTITLKGILSNPGCALTLGENGAMFTIRSGTTMILENITLEGKQSNDNALIINHGDLVMNEGTVICNNIRTSGYLGGAGVYNLGRASLNGGQIINNNTNEVGEGGGVYNSGSSAVFTMNSGKISGNNAGGPDSYNAIGGGVKIENGAKFYMINGEISGNSASTHGGGVYLWGNNSEFRMEGGSISGNSITTASSTSQGGGVYLGTGSIFKMYGGSISGNKILSTYNALGGGVYIFHAYSEFEMYGGTISGNSTLTNGGGVFLSAGSFKMFNGTISDNEVTGTSVLDGGGGLYNNNGEFTMSGGVISGNRAYRGAGVYDLKDFRISGGIVYGDNGGVLRNILINGGTQGSAISGAAYVRPLNPTTHASLGPTVETIRNSSITLEVVNAECVNNGEATGLTITGLIGSTASLKVLYGGKYLELGSAVIAGGSAAFNFTETPLAAGSWLMILDIGELYTFEGVLVEGENIIAFSGITAQQ